MEKKNGQKKTANFIIKEFERKMKNVVKTINDLEDFAQNYPGIIDEVNKNLLKQVKNRRIEI